MDSAQKTERGATNMNCNEQQRNEWQVLVYLILAAVIAYVVLFIILVLGVILTVCLTAGAAYLGYKAAIDDALWEDRRIERDRKLEAARRRQKEYFKAKGQERMLSVVDRYFDDEQEALYEKKDHLDKAVKTVKKFKEMLR
jgi:uncharacterized protein involved in cysteine biosynthesis